MAMPVMGVLRTCTLATDGKWFTDLFEHFV